MEDLFDPSKSVGGVRLSQLRDLLQQRRKYSHRSGFDDETDADSDDDACAVDLQQAVVTLLKQIRQQIDALHKLRISSIRTARHTLNTSHDRLLAVRHHLSEIQLMHRIQQLKKHAFIWNEDLQRSYKPAYASTMKGSAAGGTTTAASISSLLVRPEHFERGLSASRKATGPLLPFSSQQSRQYQSLTPQQQAVQALSPWDGSQYKLQLVESLCLKLHKKSILHGIQHHANIFRVTSRIAASAERLYWRRLLELCFASLLLESLSSRCIKRISSDKAGHLLRRKGLCSGWRALHTYRLSAEIQRLLLVKGRRHQTRCQQRAGLVLLLLNRQYNAAHRPMRRWSDHCSTVLRSGRAFMALVQVFVQRNKLRMQVQQRYTASSSDGDAPTYDASAVDWEDAMRRLLRAMLHELRRSCLQPPPPRAQRLSDHLHSASNSNLSAASYQQRLHSHQYQRRQPLDDINAASSSNNSSSGAAGDRCRAPSAVAVGYYFGERAGKGDREIKTDLAAAAAAALLPHNVRALLGDAVTARQLLPQQRFAHDSDDSRSGSAAGGAERRRSREADHSPINARESADASAALANSSFLSASTSLTRGGSLVEGAIALAAHTTDSKNDTATTDAATAAATAADASHSSSRSPVRGLSFCGRAEIDSDWERYTPRRQIELRNQLQENFQLLKFHWLIRSSHRFIRYLRRQTQLRKQSQRLRWVHKRRVRRVCFSEWRQLHEKTQRQVQLCDDIYDTKILRWVLKAWHHHCVEHVQPKKQLITQRRDRLIQRVALRCWTEALQVRHTQKDVQQQIHSYIKLRHVRAWRAAVAHGQRMRSIALMIQRRAVRTPWAQWREKFCVRRLLKSVFTLHNQAWNHRLYTQPTMFSQLFSHFTAWRGYVLQRKLDHQLYLQNQKAFFFRGATLLARTFVHWCEFVRQRRRDQHKSLIKTQIVVRLCFRTWGSYVRGKQRLRSQLLQQWEQMRAVRAFAAWRNITHLRCEVQPREYAVRERLKNAFHRWRAARPLRLLYTEVKPKNFVTAMYRSFHRWRGLTYRRQRYRAGLELLDQLYWCIKYRWSFINWPGRSNIIVARKFAEYRLKSKRNRIAFVECTESRAAEPTIDGDGMAESGYDGGQGKVLSFISEARPSLAERAEQYGFIESAALDRSGLHHYQVLMRYILERWQQYSKEEIELRHRGLRVHAAVGQRMLLSYLRKWILSTPSTAYREVTWMKKGPPRPHDEYERKKSEKRLMKVERELQSKQTMIEKRGIIKLRRPVGKENNMGNELIQRSFR